MQENNLVETFEDMYRIKFTDKQKERLINFFKASNINPDNNKISLDNNFKSFINNISPFKEIMINKLNSIIRIEDIVYCLYPVILNDGLYINISNNGNYKYSKTSIDVKNDDMEQNIIIIRSITFNSTDREPKFIEKYYIYIYNKDLDLVSDGIMLI